MAHTITEMDLSAAWVSAAEHLLRQGGEEVNLIVTVRDVTTAQTVVQDVLDAVAAEHAKNLAPVTSVANTIFPAAFYLPELGDDARSHLYQSYQQFLQVGCRLRGNGHGTYFSRLIDWPGPQGSVNQLEALVLRLKRELTRTGRPGPIGNMYELAVSAPEDVADRWAWAEPIDADLRVYSPTEDARIRMGFPCLSHVSLTYWEKRLHLTALYRNQHFLRKAYGNYLGLARLLLFVCHEVGCEPGELTCVATHADLELGDHPGLGRREIEALVARGRAALAAPHSVSA